MARRRIPYRPGSKRYAQLRKAELARRAALARANAARAKKPEARRRAKRKAAAAERGLRQIVAREESGRDLPDCIASASTASFRWPTKTYW